MKWILTAMLSVFTILLVGFCLGYSAGNYTATVRCIEHENCVIDKEPSDE